MANRFGQCTLDGPAAFKAVGDGPGRNPAAPGPLGKTAPFIVPHDHSGMVSVEVQGFGQRPLDRPASPQPLPDHARADSCAAGPLGNRQRFTPKLKQGILAHVVGLLLVVGPSAVVWAIAQIVIDSVNAASRWARTHIVEEMLERLPPSLTYGDAASPVVLIDDASGVVTSPLHVAPNSVLARLLSIDLDSPAMFERKRHDDFSEPLLLVATAGNGHAGGQGVLTNDLACSALALAQPAANHAAAWATDPIDFPENLETAECLAGEIEMFRGHDGLLKTHSVVDVPSGVILTDMDSRDKSKTGENPHGLVIRI